MTCGLFRRAVCGLLIAAPLASTIGAQPTRVTEWIVDDRFKVPPEVVDQMASVTTMAVMPTGGLVVLDAQSPAVFVLEASGKLTSRFGRSGRGPGDLVRALVSSTTISDDGEILVPQPGLRRVDRFGSDGAYIGSFPFLLPLPTAQRAVGQRGGRIAYWTMTAAREEQVAVYDLQEEKVVWSHSVFRHQQEPPRPLGLVLAPATAWCASPDGSVYFGRTDMARLSVRRPSGDEQVFTVVPGATRSLSARDAARVRSLEEARRSALSPRPSALPPIELPKALPLFASLVCARDGDVWLQQFPPVESLSSELLGGLGYAAAGSRDWVRYRSTGAVVERARIPADVVIHAANGDALFGVQSDESGEPRVVRLRRK